jgi:proteic killer suppression protein
MIKSFQHKGLRQFYETGNARRLPVQNAERVTIILQALNAARAPAQMNVAGWNWHNLAPKWPNRYSVRVTGNYRITFAFEGPNAVDVDIEDYH